MTHHALDLNRFRTHYVLGAVLVILLLIVGACAGGSDSSTADTDAADTEQTTDDSATAAATAAPAAEAAETTDQTAQEGAADQAPTVDPASVESVSELPPEQRNNFYAAPPEMTIDPEKYYYATIATEKGDIRAQLFAERAPVTVNNFVFLAREGFYDNTSFHRVLEDFMAQAGDPTGTGAGGPGYSFQDEFDPSLTFDRPGMLAMANSGPATNGSQFFITFAPTEWLNNMHTIFGEVIEGQEVLDEITLRDPNQNPDFAGDTIETITIDEAETSELPTPLPPTPTPTPFPPTSLESGSEAGERPLAQIPSTERANYFNTPPDMVIDASQSYTAVISTSQGDLTAKLFAESAPTAVNNFVVLSNLGFYDESVVNAVNPGQAIVMGAPDNTPANDVGYQLDAELNAEEPLAVGMLAYIPMRTPSGGVQSSGSQFLIALAEPPPGATAQWSFFGQITDGVDLLSSLTISDTVESITIATADAAASD